VKLKASECNKEKRERKHGTQGKWKDERKTSERRGKGREARIRISNQKMLKKRIEVKQK